MGVITVDTVRPGLGVPPAVVMYDTKYAKNASRAMRNCSAFGVEQLWITGDRWTQEWVGRKGKPRPPREERMKGYQSVNLYRCDMPLVAFEGHEESCVAVEVSASAENIAFFEFPIDPVFVFGPEDGHLADGLRRRCRRHVILPTRHCVNLADAVGMTLLTWHIWKLRNGLEDTRPSYDMLDEDRGFFDGDTELEWSEEYGQEPQRA